MTFADTGRIVIPVFGLIAIGYGASAFRLFAASVGEGLGEFVFALPIPILIFRTIATAHFPDVSPWPLWGIYFTGVVICWSLSSRVARRLFRTTHAESVVAGTSASFSNTVMIGIPLIVTAYGEAGTVPLFLIISVHLPVMMIAGALLGERAERADGNIREAFDIGVLLRRIGRNLIGNPIALGVIAGGLWRMTGIGIEGPARTIIDQFAAAAAPCALFALGTGLQRYGLLGQFGLAAVATVLKLAAMPLIVYLAGSWLTSLPPLWIAVATLCAGLPSGVNSYLFAVRFNTGHAAASSSIALSSLISILTLTLWLQYLGAVPA